MKIDMNNIEKTMKNMYESMLTDEERMCRTLTDLHTNVCLISKKIDDINNEIEDAISHLHTRAEGIETDEQATKDEHLAMNTITSVESLFLSMNNVLKLMKKDLMLIESAETLIKMNPIGPHEEDTKKQIIGCISIIRKHMQVYDVISLKED